MAESLKSTSLHLQLSSIVSSQRQRIWKIRWIADTRRIALLWLLRSETSYPGFRYYDRPALDIETKRLSLVHLRQSHALVLPLPDEAVADIPLLVLILVSIYSTIRRRPTLNPINLIFGCYWQGPVPCYDPYQWHYRQSNILNFWPAFECALSLQHFHNHDLSQK